MVSKPHIKYPGSFYHNFFSVFPLKTIIVSYNYIRRIRMENKPHLPDVIQEEKLRRIRYFLKKESIPISYNPC